MFEENKNETLHLSTRLGAAARSMR